MYKWHVWELAQCCSLYWVLESKSSQPFSRWFRWSRWSQGWAFDFILRARYLFSWLNPFFFFFFLLCHRVLATLINTGCECCCFYYLCIGAGIWGRKRGWAVAAGPPITFIYYAAALTRPKAFPIRRCQIFSRRQQCLKDLQLPSKIRQYYKSPVVWVVWCQAVKTVWYWLIASIPLFNVPAVIWLEPKLANLTLLLFFFLKEAYHPWRGSRFALYSTTSQGTKKQQQQNSGAPKGQPEQLLRSYLFPNSLMSFLDQSQNTGWKCRL